MLRGVLGECVRMFDVCTTRMCVSVSAPPEIAQMRIYYTHIHTYTYLARIRLVDPYLGRVHVDQL